MIVFHISTGQYTEELYGVTTELGSGYAGNGPGLNNPDAVDQHRVGPIPPGFYLIGQPEDRPQSTGEFSLPLTPDVGTVMFGRSEFLCHGPNAAKDVNGAQESSDGCPVAARPIREEIAKHQVMQVVP